MEENSGDVARSTHRATVFTHIAEFLDSCCFQIAFRQRHPASRATHPLHGEQKPSWEEEEEKEEEEEEKEERRRRKKKKESILHGGRHFSRACTPTDVR